MSVSRLGHERAVWISSDQLESSILISIIDFSQTNSGAADLAPRWINSDHLQMPSPYTHPHPDGFGSKACCR